ncbi:MAG: TIGR03118 family protein [Acidobacteria bacterium]|nr:MAG: TIGR03118 family protein [Acidobacteriota bacterium]
MLHPRPAKTRVRKSVSAALTALLVLAFLPAAPPASRVAAQTAGDDTQNPNIPAVPPGQAYRQTNLISDVPGLAPIQDPLLVNPWGVTATSSSPFWVVNNGTGTTQLLRGDVVGSPFVLNPSPQTVTLPGGPPSLPTGAVAVSNVTTAATDFNFTPTGGSTPVKAVFIFDSITGNIIAWNPALGATAQVVKSQPGHTYTGLAIGNSGGNPFLYAADFANGKIDVFDKTFTPTTLAGTFTDPTIPVTFHPFNIQNLGGTLFVSYAKVGTGGNVVTNGPGNGFVSKFNTDGTFIGRFVSNGALDAPWGMVIAPASFGIFGGAVLVGNFSDNGIITAYNSGGTFLGTLQNEAGQPIVNDQLWALTFGNGGAGGDPNTLYFSAGIADEEHGLFGKLNPTTATATSLVQFASDTFTIGEGSGHIDITIFRAGDASGTATVNVNTFDSSQAGHASQKSDYEIALQKVTFAPGDTSKTVRILIVNDNFVEGDETVNLALSNPTGVGVGLGSPNQATLTITDNDSSPSSTNPVDDPSFFVRQHYLDFLNREPDTAGFNFWVNNITSCGSDAQCIEVKRINTSAAFFLSIEFQQTGLLAYLANKAAFGNSPLANAAVPVLYGQFERDTQALQRNFVFGAPGADAQLEANKQAYFTDFVARPDFVAAFPTTQTPAQFVDALFANAGVTPSTSDRNAAIAEFGAATNTTDQAARARALRDVAQNTAFSQAEFNRAFVTMEYFGYLRRDPDAAGFNFWLNKLNAFNGNFVNAEMVKAFLSSSEYRQRFGAS